LKRKEETSTFHCHSYEEFTCAAEEEAPAEDTQYDEHMEEIAQFSAPGC